jgi:hypothetical protein
MAGIHAERSEEKRRVGETLIPEAEPKSASTSSGFAFVLFNNATAYSGHRLD